MTQEDTTCNQLDLDARVPHEVEMMQGQRWLEGVMTGQHETILKTHPINTLRAPNGVINIGGAKVYAAKFATAT